MAANASGNKERTMPSSDRFARARAMWRHGQGPTFALVVGVTFAATLALPSPAEAASSTALDISATVRAVMDDQYGATYDAKHTCWTYSYSGSSDDEGAHYCMRPGKPEVVDVNGAKIVYFMAANATDITDVAAYGYSQAQPGLMGAFKIRLGGKQGWTFIAMEPAMTFGTAGECGCRDAKLEKLTNKGEYGWLFTSGGVWQGTVVSNYSVVTAWKNKFQDVSDIPQISEGDQDVRYQITVQADASAPGLFPLKVVKSKAKAKVAEFTVPFDTKKARYELPASDAK
jgi:hypothetical protein